MFYAMRKIIPLWPANKHWHGKMRTLSFAHTTNTWPGLLRERYKHTNAQTCARSRKTRLRSSASVLAVLSLPPVGRTVCYVMLEVESGS